MCAVRQSVLNTARVIGRFPRRAHCFLLRLLPLNPMRTVKLRSFITQHQRLSQAAGLVTMSASQMFAQPAFLSFIALLIIRLTSNLGYGLLPKRWASFFFLRFPSKIERLSLKTLSSSLTSGFCCVQIVCHPCKIRHSLGAGERSNRRLLGRYCSS